MVMATATVENEVDSHIRYATVAGASGPPHSRPPGRCSKGARIHESPGCTAAPRVSNLALTDDSPPHR